MATRKTTVKAGANYTLRALQSNVVGTMRGDAVTVTAGKVASATGERDGRIALGGYVNGRNSGAGVALLTGADIANTFKAGAVKWNVDGKEVTALVRGNVAQKGMVAVVCAYGGKVFAWHCEADSNANNKHERGGARECAETAEHKALAALVRAHRGTFALLTGKRGHALRLVERGEIVTVAKIARTVAKESAKREAAEQAEE
jgi:hypothetical protein